MSKKSIFNNYTAECPKCGGELSPEDFLCPYCGENLKKLNEEFKEGEQQIVDAMNRVDSANKRLENAEQFVEENSFKKSKEKKKLIILFVIIGIVLSFILTGVIFVISEISTEDKIKKIEDDFHNQVVDTIVLDVENKDNEIFTDTTYQSAAGHLQESKNALKVPTYSEAYNNDAIYKSYVYLDKFAIDEVSFYDTDTVAIHGKDYSITITMENGSYYERPVDMLVITDFTMNDVVRLDDVKFGDIEFECYIVRNGYYLVANPYPDFFVMYEFHSYDYDRDIQDFAMDEWCLLKDINIEMQ